MDYHSSHKNRHTFNFYGPDEIETIAAIFSDRIEELELHGNESSISAYDRRIATWKSDRAMQQYVTHSPRNLLDLLDNYAIETEQVVGDIMENEADRDARIAQAAKRYEFGYHAGVMAAEVEMVSDVIPVPNENE